MLLLVLLLAVVVAVMMVSSNERRLWLEIDFLSTRARMPKLSRVGLYLWSPPFYVYKALISQNLLCFPPPTNAAHL